MIYIQPGLYVVINQLETQNSPPPYPLKNGFSLDKAYLAIGAFTLSETGEAYIMLSNDKDEIWFISNRHLRTHKLQPNCDQFRIEI